MNPPAPLPLRLRPGAGRRALAGHPWVFSNELDGLPKSDVMPPGSDVVISDARGRFVGRGYAHPGTLITARILSRQEGEDLDADWLVRRLDHALALRAATCAGRTAFRWVHAEADGLPGLIIDRYDGPAGPRVVTQHHTAGMERLRPLIEEVLRERYGMTQGVRRSTGRGRALEGLPDDIGVSWGQEDDAWTIDDDGAAVTFAPRTGQKTGLFLDMWSNRRRFAPVLGAGRVADLFCYVGQWGLAAARAGAAQVVCVDRSDEALVAARRNFDDNGLAGRLTTQRADVGPWLEAQAPGSFDAVVCDPPAFIQGRKHEQAGTRAYRALFTAALRLPRAGGFAVLGSCSQLLSDPSFEELVRDAAHKAGRRATVLMRGEQSPCHPVPTQVPESRYLKCWLLALE